jgi:hypothetical protein
MRISGSGLSKDHCICLERLRNTRINYSHKSQRVTAEFRIEISWTQIRITALYNLHNNTLGDILLPVSSLYDQTYSIKSHTADTQFTYNGTAVIRYFRPISIINNFYECILGNWYIFTKSLASYSRTPPWRNICFIKLCNSESEKAWYTLIVIVLLTQKSAVVFVSYDIWPRTLVAFGELKQTAVSFLFSCGEVTASDVISSISGYKWRWEIWTDSSDL